MKANKQEIMSAALLIGELTDEDPNKRINAVASLKTIGEALGSARVRNELIPHLKECKRRQTQKSPPTRTQKGY